MKRPYLLWNRFSNRERRCAAREASIVKKPADPVIGPADFSSVAVWIQMSAIERRGQLSFHSTAYPLQIFIFQCICTVHILLGPLMDQGSLDHRIAFFFPVL